jgi:hypothetical protein
MVMSVRSDHINSRSGTAIKITAIGAAIVGSISVLRILCVYSLGSYRVFIPTLRKSGQRSFFYPLGGAIAGIVLFGLPAFLWAIKGNRRDRTALRPN